MKKKRKPADGPRIRTGRFTLAKFKWVDGLLQLSFIGRRIRGRPFGVTVRNAPHAIHEPTQDCRRAYRWKQRQSAWQYLKKNFPPYTEWEVLDLRRLRAPWTKVLPPER